MTHAQAAAIGQAIFAILVVFGFDPSDNTKIVIGTISAALAIVLPAADAAIRRKRAEHIIEINQVHQETLAHRRRVSEAAVTRARPPAQPSQAESPLVQLQGEVDAVRADVAALQKAVDELRQGVSTPISAADVGEVLTYHGGSVDPEELQGAVDEIFAELRTDDRLQAEIRQLGFDPQDLLSVASGRPLTIQSSGAGLGAEAVIAVIVARELGPGVRRAVLDTWSRIVLPRLEQKFGARAVGRPVEHGNPAQP